MGSVKLILSLHSISGGTCFRIYCQDICLRKWDLVPIRLHMKYASAINLFAFSGGLFLLYLKSDSYFLVNEKMRVIVFRTLNKYISYNNEHRGEQIEYFSKYSS